MAIRKFRSYMKPFIWFITVAFILSTAIVGLTSYKSMHDRVKTYAFKLDKNKVQRVELEREKAAVNRSYSKFLGTVLEKDTADLMAFDQLLTKKLTLELAKDLHIKATSSEVNDQFEAIEKSIGNKEQFKRMLAAQGFTKKTFKEELEQNIIIQKTINKIEESIKPTDEELKAEYDKNKYVRYNGKSFDAVLGNVKQFIIRQKTMEQYLSLIAAKKQTATITDVANEYKAIIPQVIMQEDGIEVTNLDLAKRALIFMKDTKDKQLAEKEAKEYYKKELALLSKAKSEGIEINKKLPVDYQIAQYQDELYTKIVNSINPTDAELKDYFSKNSIKYDTFPTAKADIAILKVVPSDADKAVAKEKAEKILKELTVQNFAQKAKEYSQGPTSSNGGELGWFSKGDMVEPFQKAVFEGEVGKIYPAVVETPFGYHLIYVEAKDEKAGKAKASHILIIPKVSTKTLDEKMNDLTQLKNKLSNGDLTFKSASQNRTDVIQSGEFAINNAGYISGLGYNEKLATAILDAPLNQVELEKVSENEFCLFKKLQETKYKKAKLEDVKDEVIADYKNFKAQEEVKKILN